MTLTSKPPYDSIALSSWSRDTVVKGAYSNVVARTRRHDTSYDCSSRQTLRLPNVPTEARRSFSEQISRVKTCRDKVFLLVKVTLLVTLMVRYFFHFIPIWKILGAFKLKGELERHTEYMRVMHTICTFYLIPENNLTHSGKNAALLWLFKGQL